MATMPARIASGSRGHASLTADRSGGNAAFRGKGGEKRSLIECKVFSPLNFTSR